MTNSGKLVILIVILSAVLSLAAWADPNTMLKSRKDNWSQQELKAESWWRWTQSKADSVTGFDITKYEITLTIDDVARTVSGNVKATVLAEESLSAIQYNLIALTVSEVRVNNQPMAFTHQNGIINIPLNIAAGQQFTTQVFYHGSPQLSANLYSIGMYFSASYVFTISDPDAGRQWWPCYDYPWDKAIVDLHITMRSDWKVAANGIRTGIVDNGNGTHTTHWLGSNPMTTYLVCLHAAAYVEINQNAGDIPIQSFVYQHQYSNAVNDFIQVPAMVDYFSGLFGDYPFEKYGHAIVNMSTYAAMEHQTMTSLGFQLIPGNGAGELVIAHELAHQWYGDSVSFLTFKDVWLSEGFATYSEHLWVDKRWGWQTAVAYVLSSYHQYYLNWEAANGPRIIYNPSFYNYFTPPSYEKAASVLHMLRLKVGDAIFFDILQTYYTTYHNHNSITAEFQAIAEQLSGQDLNQFFYQWIYCAGIPELRYMVMSKPDPPQVKVIGKTLSNTATPFTIDFPIRLNHASGSDSLLLIASPQGYANIIDLAQVTGNETVVADPNNWVLLRQKQSTVPVLAHCMPTNGAVLLSWDPLTALGNITGYRVYRRPAGTGAWTQIAFTAGDGWLDETVTNGTTYDYAIAGVDDAGFATQRSVALSATPQAFTFTHNLLVVDETRDGNGNAISPTDQMVDDFYRDALAGYGFDEWNLATQGLPALTQLGRYKVILYHDDDFTNQYISDALNLWGGYLMGGGKMLISGWKTAGELDNAFRQRFTPGISILFDNGANLISATSDLLPDLYPDPAKLAAAWSGRLPMVHTFTGAQYSLYQAVMTDGSNGSGQSAAFRSDYDNGGSLVLFGFPLYFMQADGVYPALRNILVSLNPALPVAPDDAPPAVFNLSCYPNPFAGSIRLVIEKGVGEYAEIAVYNLRGQLVTEFAIDPTKGREIIQWDGRDDQRKRIAQGIYLLRLSGKDRSLTRKILYLNQ